MSGPDLPDQNKASIAGAQADLENFPFEYQVNALAQMGGKATIDGKEYDFTGLGNADTAAKMSDQMAQAMLDIQRNYGADYIKQSLKDLQQSDPQGYAARKQLFDKIIADADAHPNRPIADDLQNQVNEMLQNSGHLDKQGLEQVQQGVRGGQVANGIFLGNAAESQEAGAVVGASDQLKEAQQNAGLSYLQSGVSPQDVEYRRIQQSLANLGAFQNNETPIAQFSQVSGAQQGAAPFQPVNYQTPASVNPNSGLTGINFANSVYGAQQGQANPFLSGLTTGVNTYGAINNMFPQSSQYNFPSWSTGGVNGFSGGMPTGSGIVPSSFGAPTNFNTTPVG